MELTKTKPSTANKARCPAWVWVTFSYIGTVQPEYLHQVLDICPLFDAPDEPPQWEILDMNFPAEYSYTPADWEKELRQATDEEIRTEYEHGHYSRYVDLTAEEIAGCEAIVQFMADTKLYLDSAARESESIELVPGQVYNYKLSDQPYMFLGRRDDGRLKFKQTTTGKYRSMTASTASRLLIPILSSEKISPKTAAAVSNTQHCVFDDVKELERAIYAKAAQIIGPFKERLEIELYPLLWQMNERLPHGQWIPWFDRFTKRTGLKLSLRTVQDNLRTLRNGGNNRSLPAKTESDDEADDAIQPASVDDAPTPVVYGSPKEMLSQRLSEMRADLLEGSGPVDADPIRDSEARIARAIRRLEEVQLAIDEGLLGVPDASAGNPILTKLPVPDSSAGDDPHAALLQAAFIAGAKASNAVTEADIEPWCSPTVTFYTTRASMKLSKYLREHGAEFNVNYQRYRGKHCFTFGDRWKITPHEFPLPMFKTREEAMAFQVGFRSALPDTVVWGTPPSNGG
jgi:hypothetical protein